MLLRLKNYLAGCQIFAIILSPSWVLAQEKKNFDRDDIHLAQIILSHSEEEELELAIKDFHNQQKDEFIIVGSDESSIN
jgi:hypothetical protein